MANNTFNLSGNFSGAILNIQSTLLDVQQAVGEMNTSDEASRQELKDLIAQLSKALETTPPAQALQAKEVADQAKTLVEQASAPKPNKSILHVTGEGLKQAAKDLEGAIPSILGIATQIVLTVAKLGGIP